MNKSISIDKEKLIQWLLTIGVALFIANPILMSVLAIIHRDIDYTVRLYPNMIRDYIWTISTVLIAISYLLFFLEKSKNKKPSDKKIYIFLPFLLTAFWMAFSNLHNGWIRAYNITRGETIDVQLRYFIILFPGALLINDLKLKRTLLRLHMITGIVLTIAAFILWHTQNISSIFSDWTPRFSSIYTNTNYYGYFLALTIPLSAALYIEEEIIGWKLLALVSLAVNTISLVINDTFGAWVGAGMAMLILLLFYLIRKKECTKDVLISFSVFLLCLGIVGLFTGNLYKNTVQLILDLFHISTHSDQAEKAGSGRWHIWKESLNIISKNPVYGIGFECVEKKGYLDIIGNLRPHCEPIQYALFYGIPGGILYVISCFSTYFPLFIKKKTDGLGLVCLFGALGYLISSCFGLTVFATAPFLFIYLGMGVGGYTFEEKNNFSQ